MLSSSPFDRFAQTYNATRVLNPGNFTFNQAAYDAYSPLYLSLGFVFTYISSFAVTTCVLVHTILYHGPALLNGMKRIKTEEDDVHAKLMRLYPEVPDWWYLAVFLFFFVMGILAATVSASLIFVALGLG
jgi:OPT oligopeptide transporter protein